MKVLHKIRVKILYNRQRNEDISRICRVENISEWLRYQKKGRIVKLVKDNFPAGRRNIGWPRRHWSDNIDPVREAGLEKEQTCSRKLEKNKKKKINIRGCTCIRFESKLEYEVKLGEEQNVTEYM